MKKIFLTAFLVLVSCSFSYGQIDLDVSAAFSNFLRYGSGYEYTGTLKNPKEYFENLTDGRLNVNDITFGIRYNISQPREYGLDFIGIDKRFVEYKHKAGVTLRAGDFWEIISRGMTLNVFEDRQLGYDTGIDGVRVTYEHTFNKNKNPFKLKAQVIGGNIDFSDYLTPERIERYRVRNAFGSISPIKPLTMGINYVHSEGELPEEGVATFVESDVSEAIMNLNYSDFQFYASYAYKSSIVTPNEIYPTPMTGLGDGFYSSVSYSFDKFGLTLEYKNYRFDITLPNNRSVTRPTRMLPYQNPPTAQLEPTWTLISRNPHVVDFNDEVGGQFDLVYSPNEIWNFHFNTSVASRHYQYENIETTSGVYYERIDRSDSWLPDFDDPFYPFWELYLEGEYYGPGKIYGKAAFARQNSVLYNQLFPESSEKIFTTTIPAEFKYSFTKEYTLTFIGEQQWVHNSLRTSREADENFTNQLLSLTFSRSPDLGVTASIENTNDDEEPTGKDFWWFGELTYKINQSNTVAVSYGSERGGLRCANGICRYVQPFEGFRMSIATQY